jgi:hypothetical protein
MYSGEDALGTVNGNQYSFAIFEGIQAALTGQTIVSCQLVVSVDYVVNGALTGTLVIGYSDISSFPDTGMSLAGATPNVAQCSVTGVDQPVWSIDLSTTSIPAAFQSGLATNILLGPGPTTSDVYYAEVTGLGVSTQNPPQLIFQVNLWQPQLTSSHHLFKRQWVSTKTLTF